jgi:hypothetical protein
MTVEEVKRIKSSKSRLDKKKAPKVSSGGSKVVLSVVTRKDEDRFKRLLQTQVELEHGITFKVPM